MAHPPLSLSLVVEWWTLFHRRCHHFSPKLYGRRGIAICWVCLSICPSSIHQIYPKYVSWWAKEPFWMWMTLTFTIIWLFYWYAYPWCDACMHHNFRLHIEHEWSLPWPSRLFGSFDTCTLLWCLSVQLLLNKSIQCFHIYINHVTCYNKRENLLN